MRKIHSVFLTVMLFAAYQQTVFASGNEPVPTETKITTSPLACPAAGTYTIGPGGDYASITAALADLYSCASITGAFIFELRSNYVSSAETFPITINAIPGTSAANTITFRPEAGATALSITSANTTGTILFDDGDFVIFDGRPGGNGIARELTLQNTNIGNAYAVRFVNDAVSNTIQYCNIRSANNNTSGGTIILAGTNGTTGNDNITIANNAIFDAATGTPNNAIISSGSIASTAAYNNNITISNNSIYNFFGPAGDIAGVKAVQGSSDWIISNNNFYHTFGTLKTITGIFSAISAYNSDMENFAITGNYVGNTVATISANIQLSGGILQIFRLSLGTAVANSIQGNTIWNINISTGLASPLHCIVNLADGAYNVGTVTGNTIGNAISTGNIAINLGGNVNTNCAMINCGSGTTGMGAVNISNNLIGNIDLAGLSVVANLQLVNFGGSTGTYTINNNVLGSNDISESVNNWLNTTFAVVNGNMSTGSHSITNNSINRCYLKSAGSNENLYGVRVQGNATYNISGNTFNTFQSAATNTATYHLIGIYNTATAPNQVIARNAMYIFNTTATTVRTGMAGIYYDGPAGGTNIIEKNFIHTFAANSSITSTQAVGIHAAGGATTYRNNMVRMGISSAGANLTTAQDFEGIREEGGTNNFYFNSIYIGAVGVGSGNSSYAFYSTISTNTIRSYLNNIFYNARSNASLVSPAHYAMRLNSAAGVTSNYNILYANGTGKMLANFNGTDISTLGLWRTTVGGDANSMSADPQFILPAGAWNVVDLHIKSSPAASIVEANGLNIASVTDDYDVQARATFSPTDIGADAGNFLAVSKADMGPVNLLNPTGFACLNAVTPVKVVIKNFNNVAINFASAPVNLVVAVTGAITTNLSTIINTGSLAAGDTLIVTLPATLNMSAAGSYNFSITTAVGGSQLDVDVTNNIYTTTVTPGAYNVGTLSSSVVNFCNTGIPVLTLMGTFGTVQWQQSLSSGGPWTNVGINSLTYSPAAIVATTYFQALVSCGAAPNPSNEVNVLVIPASIANTAALADGVGVVTVCDGASLTLTQTGGSIISGAQWQWYEGTPANNFITAVGSPTTAANAATVITPTINATYYLRASGGTAPCDGNLPASNTGNPVATVIVNAPGTWLGNNTNWNDAGNWCGAVPSASTDALIPAGLSNYPVIGGAYSVRNISIQAGASVTLSATDELAVKGNFNSSGIINNNGKIILNGTALQSFPGSSAIIAAMNILEIDNNAGVTIDGSFAVTGTLKPTSGTITLNNSSVTLHSDAAATANVGPLGSSAGFNYSGAGKFVVERFVPAKRAWRLLTAPVTPATAPDINSAWQEGATQWPMGPATAASNPVDGYGTHISGGANANGYDQNVNGNPSIKVFTGGSWLGLSVATSLYTKKLTDEQGYMLFVRGSRAVDLSFGTATVPNNTTLRIPGRLKVANVTPVGITSSGLTVVGNPFASAINFNTVATENSFTQAENKYYLWDPTLTGSNGVGAWVTLAYNGINYDRTVVTANDYTSSGGSQGIDDIGTIQSGAAFMMYFGAGTKTVDFNETVKTAGSTSTVFRPMRKQLRTNLHLLNSNATTALLDGVLTTYNPAYSNDADALDIDKLSNFSENFGLMRQGRVFAIERRSPVAAGDTIFFKMAQMKQRNYQLEFLSDSMSENNIACYLEDIALNSSTAVNLTAPTKINFSITGSATARADRFRLVFKKWLHFTNCNAMPVNDNVAVDWQVMKEHDLLQYEIERSTDDINFTIVGNKLGAGNSNEMLSYQFTDLTPAAGDYFYRIKAVSAHGVSTYSNIAKVRVLKSSPSLYVFPNPVINNQINLQAGTKLPQGNYVLRLLDADGKTVVSKKISHTGGAVTYTLIPAQSLATGNYQLEVLLPNKSRQVIQVAVQ